MLLWVILEYTTDSLIRGTWDQHIWHHYQAKLHSLMHSMVKQNVTVRQPKQHQFVISLEREITLPLMGGDRRTRLLKICEEECSPAVEGESWPANCVRFLHTHSQPMSNLCLGDILCLTLLPARTHYKVRYYN